MNTVTSIKADNQLTIFIFCASYLIFALIYMEKVWKDAYLYINKISVLWNIFQQRTWNKSFLGLVFFSMLGLLGE